MAIPKIIHYVWMGRGTKNKDIAKCMDSWKRHLGDYQMIEWNEDNFDIESNIFVSEAYRQGKWAFVSDYVRMYAIYKYGGIYLDTDVLVLDNLKHFLNNRAFVGFETDDFPFTAVFGAEPGHPLMKNMLDYYDAVRFDYDKNDPLCKVNTRIVGNLLIAEYGCAPDNKLQRIREGIQVYPDYILCNPSKYSSAIHIFTRTWRVEHESAARLTAKFIRLRLSTRRRAGIYRAVMNFRHKI